MTTKRAVSSFCAECSKTDGVMLEVDGICPLCGGRGERKPCQHRHLHPGRYGARLETSYTVCLDCRVEVAISGPTSGPNYSADYSADRYTIGRTLAAEDLKTAPIWPASRADFAGLTRPHDPADGGASSDFYPTPAPKEPTE